MQSMFFLFLDKSVMFNAIHAKTIIVNILVVQLVHMSKEAVRFWYPSPHPHLCLKVYVLFGMSCCKFWIYWKDVNTKFTIWQLWNTQFSIILMIQEFEWEVGCFMLLWLKNMYILVLPSPFFSCLWNSSRRSLSPVWCTRQSRHPTFWISRMF